MKNKLILQPKDLIQLHFGLRIENVGDVVIEIDYPTFAKIYPVSKPEIKNVSVTQNQ